MPKFKPKLVPTLATLVGFGLLIALGTWQAQRYSWKLDIEEQRDQNMVSTPIEVSSLKELQDLDYRKVRAKGKLLTDYSVFFKFRMIDGKSGYWVASPMVFDDGAILVQRGWSPIEQKPENLDLKEADSVEGLVYALDRVIADADTRDSVKELDKDTLQGWNTLDLDAVYERLPFERPQRPALLVLDKNVDADLIASLEHITQPYMTSEKHLGYSITWYTLSVGLLMLWVASSFGKIGGHAPRRS